MWLWAGTMLRATNHNAVDQSLASTAWAMAWRTPTAAVAGAVVENSSWTIDEEIFWPVWAEGSR